MGGGSGARRAAERKPSNFRRGFPVRIAGTTRHELSGRENMRPCRHSTARHRTTGNITDELPKEGDLYKDLKFFESNFGGVMPLEVVVNTKKKNGLLKSYNLIKIEQLSQELASFKEFSKPSSYVDMVKFSKQAFYNGDSAYYSLPNSQEQRMILSYGQV